MLAGAAVGPVAVAEFDLALVEVLLEFRPLLWADRAVFVGRAERAAAGQEVLVVPHGVLLEHCDVALRGSQLQVPEKLGADMNRQVEMRLQVPRGSGGLDMSSL